MTFTHIDFETALRKMPIVILNVTTVNEEVARDCENGDLEKVTSCGLEVTNIRKVMMRMIMMIMMTTMMTMMMMMIILRSTPLSPT